ncbi:membrane anchor in succinate dehydrogenase complex [Scheffersomyces stipitis CBS 6054]|uniref:Succinate dehydrogenase [ubiquinone] cytochrome b small subunit n=1 Tax=Scheffersomyces stipitis (strain ATCC 58785 / CBS 6054 / NBRC 10063 / NRRL Y-11545) TaxID=322104 RepID=A3LQM9_PICST|nr:membrane anchor in succinate dehydrogenase complex [Scheffersomyces stipitis CBS 6054]ABN65231.1 membrane anchor in succinate dehydrogenase complex [Scheffersomyces stipitis CBS 6054]
MLHTLGSTRTAFSVIKPVSLLRPTGVARFISLKPDFSRFKKTEQPPGYIVGTVNDAYRIPLVTYYEGSYHWTYERAIAITMVPLMMTPFVAGVEYPMIDAVFSSLVLFHCHCGFKSCIIDYIPERVYGFWHRAATRLLTLGSFVSLYGVYLIETEGNGLFDLLKNIWMA